MGLAPMFQPAHVNATFKAIDESFSLECIPEQRWKLKPLTMVFDPS